MVSQQIAGLLLNINAVQINPTQPFCFSSGLYSPIYCDNRLLISYPEHRQTVCQAFADIIDEQQLTPEVIAGTATAGIPHAAWLAERLQRPMIYIRSSAKSHGKQNQIEGKLSSHQQALLIEDLISTGQSALNAIDAIRAQQAKVSHCLAIVQYGFEEAISAFNQTNTQLISLTDFNTLITVAIEQQRLTEADADLCRQWHRNPQQWSEQFKATAT